MISDNCDVMNCIERFGQRLIIRDRYHVKRERMDPGTIRIRSIELGDAMRITPTDRSVRSSSFVRVDVIYSSRDILLLLYRHYSAVRE